MAFLLNEDGSFLLNEDGTKIVIDEDEELADPIDLITANPDTANPTSFATEADLYVTQFKASIPQLNTAFTALRLVSVSDVSNTSNTITEGTKTFTVSANKSFLPGQYLNIADAADPTTNNMLLQVASYSGTTLIGLCVSTHGSGTKTNWVISLSAPPVQFSSSASLFHAHTGNLQGTVNTKIRRLATVVTNTGENIEWNYLDSATLGGSITFIRPGVYMVNYIDQETNVTGYGLSKNSNQLTTSFASITEAHKLLVVTMAIGSLGNGVCTYFAAGDVLRMHTDGSNTDSAGISRLRLERII